MKIAIVLGHALPVPPVAGGAIESRAWELAGAFATKGHQVTLYSRAWEGMPAEEAVCHNFRVKRFAAPGWGASRWRNMLGSVAWGRKMAKVIEPADAIVCKNFFLPFLLRGSPLLDRVFIGLHRTPKAHYRLYAWLLRRAGHGPTLVAVSNFVRAATERLSRGFYGKVIAIPNPVDLDRFLPDPSARAQIPTILFAGRFAADKGLLELLRSVLELHRRGVVFQLRLAGSTRTDRGSDEAVLDAMRAFIAAHGLDQVVRFVGFKSSAELAEEYRSAWIFCYPSQGGEAWPNAIMESLACGTPVVTTDFGPFPEMFTNGVEGFQVGCGADGELSDRLQELLGNEELRQRMEKSAPATASNYSLDRISDRYLKAFDQVSARSR